MATSVASGQFPHIVWRDGQKYVWNPIQRQALKNRPEERVRLRIVEYLTRGGWSKHRISTEEAIALPHHASKLRTDLLCYTRDFSPLLLVECKAENVKLSAQTATQIARYNQKVSAPLLLLTNGQTDYWYKIDSPKAIELLRRIPETLPQKCPPPSTFDYWKKRGFAGTKASPRLRGWLQEALNAMLISSTSRKLRYLSFNQSPIGFSLANYYYIFTGDDKRLAITCTATPYGGNRMIAILNKKGKNGALMELNLDLWFDGQAPNASIYSAMGPHNFDLNNYMSPMAGQPFDPEKSAPIILKMMQNMIQ